MKKKNISFNGKLNKVLWLIIIAAILVGMGSAQRKMYALGTGEWAGIPGENLDPKGLGAAMAARTDPVAAMDYIKECNTLHPGSISAEEIETILNQGYLTEYVDELKSLGYISSGYTLPSSGSSAPTETNPASEPEPFTVEDMEDTPMWATQTVNYRDGASTDYNKLGSLEQYEQVIVNGVASTGWYRFNTADGNTAYVSKNYLTTEDPSNRELNIYNEETEQVDTFIFEDTDPEVIDQVIEEIKEEYAEKEPVIEESEEVEEETETVVEEPQSDVEELPMEVVDETPAHSWQFYLSIAFAAICVIVIIVCICYVIRNKKSGRVD